MRSHENPMYVGWTFVHLGLGLLRNDAWIVAALPLASAAVHRGVRREEALLETAFPAEFSRYRESVPPLRAYSAPHLLPAQNFELNGHFVPVADARRSPDRFLHGQHV
jgi:hypothetical protein